MVEDDQFRTAMYEFVGGAKSTLRHLTESFEKLEDCQRQDKKTVFEAIEKNREFLLKDINGLREAVDTKIEGVKANSVQFEVSKDDLKDIQKSINELRNKIEGINVKFEVGYTKIVAWGSGAGFMVSLLFWLIKLYAGKYIGATP